jgi:hypothetical protein
MRWHVSGTSSSIRSGLEWCGIPPNEGRRLAYRELFDVPESEAQLEAIREAISRGTALGSDSFLDELHGQFGSRLKRRNRARNRRSPAGIAEKTGGFGSVPGVTLARQDDR